MATLWYGSMRFPVAIKDAAKLASSERGPVDEDAVVEVLRRVIRRIAESGQPSFLPLPVRSDDGKRTEVLITPGIPVAIVSDYEPDSVDHDLAAVVSYWLDDGDDHGGGSSK